MFALSVRCSVLIIIVIFFISSSQGQSRGMVRPPRVKKATPFICLHDTLTIFQDCRICFCQKTARPAQCVRKQCEARTKDTGQCPPAVMRLDDRRICNIGNPSVPNCRTDTDCPGSQLCCFDYCEGTKCADPVPKDSAGVPIAPYQAPVQQNVQPRGRGVFG